MSGKRSAILVVSSVNMDLVLQMEHVPVAGQTLFGRDYIYVPGGKGANQAVAAARLGADVTFVGKVGDDAHGAVLATRLEEEGINVDHLKVDPDEQTGLAIILLEEGGENRILVYPGANMAIEPAQVHQAFERDYDAVMLNLEIGDEIVAQVVDLARKRDIPAVLDAGPARAFDLAQLHGLEILSPNETEATSLTGLDCNTPEQAALAARRLSEISGARFVVIKMGDQGALLLADGETEFLGAHNVKAVDTTAAGDAFTGALTLEYLRTGDIAGSIAYANIAGALAVTKLGAQPSLPTMEQMAAFVRERKLTVGKRADEADDIPITL